MAVRAISLFAGVGGLDLGVRLAIPESRTVCYVEVEAYAAAVLAARMQEGSLDEAPIFSEIDRFPAKAWRGKVDLVHGGIPCQPYSLAGERKGEEDDRALWPEFARVVAECRPSLVFIENVPAFVMGGGFRPLGEELCRLGYELEDPFFIGAKEVGAPHIRERVFILAHHVADGFRERLEERSGLGRNDGQELTPAERSGRALADSEGLGVQGSGSCPGGEQERSSAQRGRSIDGGGYVADSTGDGRAEGPAERRGVQEMEGPPSFRLGACSRGEDLADASRPRFRVTRCSRKSGKRFQAPLGNDAHRRDKGLRGEGPLGRQPVPDAERDGVREQPERGSGGARETVAWYAEPFPVGLYPPGPKDLDEWEDGLGVAPWLAPSVEPGVRLLVDGVAMVVDENRAHQLRCTGNGVVPMCAAQAMTTLLEWAGLR